MEHASETLKKCPSCGGSKPLEDFFRQAASKDGRYPYCKTCTKVRQTELYARRNNEKRRAYKVCPWCQQDLQRSNFRTAPNGKHHSRCASCEDEIAARESDGLRRCNICRDWLPHDRFHASKLRFPHIACKVCARKQLHGYKDTRRSTRLMKEYGITVAQYDELVAKQGGVCPICKDPFGPDNIGHVDHAHGGKFAGVIRAIVHRDCNRFVLWTHEDSAQLRAAADLIDHPLTDWVVPKPTANEVRWDKTKTKRNEK